MIARDRVHGVAGLAFCVWVCGWVVSVAGTPILLEPDYTLTTLPAGVGSAGLACSPGGAWGEFVYFTDSAAGTVERIDFDDIVSPFAGPFNFPVGLEFGPGPASDFDTLLYVGDFASSEVKTVTTEGTIASFTPLAGPGQLTFDPSAVYGTKLFATSRVSSSIRTISVAGKSDFFCGVPSDSLGFGPGGLWSSGLYSSDRGGSVSGPDCCFEHDDPGCSDADCRTEVCNLDPTCCSDEWSQACANLALEDGACDCVGYGPGIVRIDSAGTPVSFVDGFVTPQGFDWADGAGWNGDMFVADLADGVVRRLTPGGIGTDFARIAGAADVAFCNCSLYVASLEGGRWRVTSDADDPDLDGTGEACDTCPGFFNPPGVVAVFGMEILASSKTEFSWPAPSDARYLRGPLGLVSDYAVDYVDTIVAGAAFSDTTIPDPPGAGFYYLARPDCPGASWQSSLGAEPVRDVVLP